ncbi:MAG: guanylate kinase [Clostridia bacterium]|nr:guanylate kinase [Clostridia bacterium]
MKRRGSQLSNNLFVLSGPSGSGKNTVYNGVAALIPEIEKTVSATTRAPREGEIDGVDYYFIPVKEFEKKIRADEFVEFVKYGDNYYGTLRSEIKRLADIGKIAVLIIEVRGALNVKRVFPESESIFILPPSIDVLRERILGRGQNTEEETEKRLRIAEQEMLEKEKYDHRVINDDLEVCVNEVADIIRKGVKKK